MAFRTKDLCGRQVIKQIVFESRTLQAYYQSSAMSIVLPSFLHLSEREAEKCIQYDQSKGIHRDICVEHSQYMEGHFGGGYDVLFAEIFSLGSNAF